LWETGNVTVGGHWSRKATIVTLVLVVLAFVAPRAAGKRESGMAGAATAVILYAIIMTTALGVASGTAIGAFLESRKAGRAMPAEALAPLGIFFAGLVGIVVLVAMRAG
jgi:uncharacterized membrane protein